LLPSFDSGEDAFGNRLRPAAKKEESHIRRAAALLGLAITPALAVENGKFADFGA